MGVSVIRSIHRAALATGSLGLALLLAAPSGATTLLQGSDPTLTENVVANDGTYTTYGSSQKMSDLVGAGALCSGSRVDTSKPTVFVPVMVAPEASDPDCVQADALPGGPGSFADQSSVWAPGIIQFNDTYFLYFTYKVSGSNHHCIAVASSPNARGPFKNPQKWRCPANGKWAIDPRPLIYAGHLYVAYRDDTVNNGTGQKFTGISVQRVGANGMPTSAKKVTLLLSKDVPWASDGIAGDKPIIENPALWHHGKTGDWYLFFSGNGWGTDDYSTGIADCGSTPVPSGGCHLIGSTTRPYFGWSGSRLNPLHLLPGDHPGAAGLDLSKFDDGTKYVVWAWHAAGQRTPRHLAWGEMTFDNGVFSVS
jgi:hypothetical protein